MRFSVKTWSSNGGGGGGGGGRARVGALQLDNCPTPIETPALLLSTRKGLPVFIAPDLLPSLPYPDSLLLQVSPLHFIDCPTPKTISSLGGLHQMVGLHDYGFVAAPRDTLLCLPVCESANKTGASFETPTGRRLVKPSEYMEMISSLKPNLWASLADEVPAWVNVKRNKTSVDRTVRWLDDCIALIPAGDSSLLGAIVGGPSVEERVRCAQEVVKRNVSGYWIGGFGLGESSEERPALLCSVTDILPKEKPRQIFGLGLPEEILQAVASGVDLVESSYINHLTLGGFALTFPLNTNDGHLDDSHLSDMGGDLTKINLRATIYRKDTSPIVVGCGCYTCKNHTRAYINHLLNVHEMLAPILLEIHNTYHYLGFFQAIREAIKSGEFEVFHRKFVESRRNHIALAAVCS